MRLALLALLKMLIRDSLHLSLPIRAGFWDNRQ